MFRTSLLLFAFCVAWLNAARLPNPVNLGNGGLRVSMMDRRNAEFGEGVRDWFRNMRDRIFGKGEGKGTSNQMKSSIPFDFNSSPMTNILKNNMEMERMMIHPMNFFLDLSTLKFDPSQDWGFHIVNWYIIRKSDGSDDQWDDNWNNFFESTSAANSDANEGTLRPPQTVTSLSSNKQIGENETMDNTASVEVLKPAI